MGVEVTTSRLWQRAAGEHDELVRFGMDMLKRDLSTGQYFEIIRGNPLDLSLKNITRKELKALHDKLYAVHAAHADRLFANVDPSFRWFPKMYYLGTLKFIFETHGRNVEAPRKWAMPCTAELTSMVIDHNVEFRACELRQPLGYAMVGGLILSQALTLYTTPVVYLYLDKFRVWLATRRGQASAMAPHLAPEGAASAGE